MASNEALSRQGRGHHRLVAYRVDASPAHEVIGGIETAVLVLSTRLAREHYAFEREMPELVDIGGEGGEA